MQKVNHIVKVSASRQTYKDYEKSNLNSHGVDVIKNLKKWAKSGLFFISFRLFKHTIQFLQPVYGAGIQTYDLWNMSLLP